MPAARMRSEEGGLLIVLMVGVAVMFIGVAVAVQAWSTTWRRDSEDELIFRGNQYVDAILAYRKDHNGQFPVNLDDLMKIGPRQVRYIRKLFKDPVNPGGQWGLLYLMPGGNAIYDPVAAQQATETATDDSVGGSGGVIPGKTDGGAKMGGITPINFDPTGTGMMQGAGPGQTMLPGQGGVPGTALRGGGMRGTMPGGMGGMGGVGGMAGGLGGMRGGMGGFAAGGMSGMGAGGAWGGGALPPPKPRSSSFDDDSASEPPIGWPIVGVISRANGDIADRTYKIYKGHEKVNEWQFHVFDTNIDQGQAPAGTVPGGSPAPFIGPGFGGRGAIGGFGGGAGMNRGTWPGYGGGQYPGGGQPGGQQGGRQQKPPGQGGRGWEPPPPPGGTRNQ